MDQDADYAPSAVLVAIVRTARWLALVAPVVVLVSHLVTGVPEVWFVVACVYMTIFPLLPKIGEILSFLAVVSPVLMLFAGAVVWLGWRMDDMGEIARGVFSVDRLSQWLAACSFLWLCSHWKRLAWWGPVARPEPAAE